LKVEKIVSESAPNPIGPYSQAIRAGGFLFTSGQLPLNPADGKPVAGDVRLQARRVLENLAAVLKAADLDFSSVVRTVIYTTDLSLFKEINAEYGEHFSKEPYPARSTVQVAALPLGCAVMMDMTAKT